jgi:hypothetical protein
VVVESAIKPFIPDIIDQIHLGLAIKNKNAFVCPEALVCISMLSKAVGPG